MRLQSKKNSKASPFIIAVFVLSLVYWSYLSLATNMIIVFDAVGYKNLGTILSNQGWIAYFTTGPNREPLYPLLIAASMRISALTGLDFTRIMAFFGVLILFLTQVLTYKILRLLNIRRSIRALVLIYLALSPALNNAAFSLFSEIAGPAIILGIMLISFYLFESFTGKGSIKSIGLSVLLALLLVAATFVKAGFECITPIYLLVFFGILIIKQKPTKFTILVLSVVAALNFYYAPIIGYKWLNWHYNGNFVVTDRGPWALYGSTARRTAPLTLKKFAEAAAFVPGEGLCHDIFKSDDCDFWSFRESDALAFAKVDELQQRHLPPQRQNTILIRDSAHMALAHPLQYAILTLMEGLKMFFWESTKVGFVGYPSWIGKIYNIKLFNNGLRFLMFFLSFIAVLRLWRQALSASPAILPFIMGVLIFLYILSFSFFFILTRYCLPIAPLYLISIGLWLEQKLAPKKSN